MTHTRPERGNRDLRLLVTGNAVSSLGNAVYLIAVTLLLKELTDSALVLGLFQFLALFPGFLLSPLSGAFIDRYSRRSIIAGSDIYRGVIMMVAGGALFFPSLQSVWLILPVSMLAGVGHAFFVPAAQALLPSIVPAQRLHRATALRASSSQLANLTGNAAGGLLYALLGAPVLFLANGLSFIVSALYELRITSDARPRAESVRSSDRAPSSGLLSAARAGLRELVSRPSLVRLMVSQAGLFLLSPVLMLSLPFIVIDELMLPQFAVGIYFALALVGGIASFLLVRRMSATELLDRPIVRLSYGAMALGFAGAAFFSNPVTLGVVALVIGAAAGGVYLAVTTWIQVRTPSTLHGRLFSLLEAGSAAIAPVSYLLAGVLLELVGAEGPWIVFLGAGGIAAIWAVTGVPDVSRSG